MKIKKKVIAKGTWGKNYTPGRTQKVKYIVIHYTASGAAALNNLNYFASRYVGASAHLFIDVNGDIYQSVELADTAWAVGAKSYKHQSCRNSNSVSIEVVNAGKAAYTAAQIKALKSVVPELMKKYGGVPAENVLRHYDVTGKICPAYYCGSTGKDKRWKELHGAITGSASTSAKPSTPAFKAYKVKVTADSLIVRKNASTSAAKVKSLKKGTAVTVTDKTTGTSVGGNKTWLKVSGGYIAEKYTKKV
jgi:N-acetyl-anhydromuramyl-L-alanine amidase AmpD